MYLVDSWAEYYERTLSYIVNKILLLSWEVNHLVEKTNAEADNHEVVSGTVQSEGPMWAQGKTSSGLWGQICSAEAMSELNSEGEVEICQIKSQGWG